MISFIVCSKDSEAYEFHRMNVQKTAGCSIQNIRIDNSAGLAGICAAYNKGAATATGDVLCFMHEDVFFMEEGWGPRILQKFQEDEQLGMVGLAGTTYLDKKNMKWTWAKVPWLAGRVVHEIDEGRKFFLNLYDTENEDREVVVLDGLCLFVRPSLMQKVRFDEETFPGFHLYDLDFCMQARRHAKVICTKAVLVKHLSVGKFDEQWHRAAQAFAAKWEAELPAQSVHAPQNGSLPPGDPVPSQDLRGRMAQVILL